MSIKKKREELQLLRDEALDAYLNREEFQYDADADALYRHYKDQYTQLGQKAMQDTMGQASALTGGYGSSYAQNVGQQAYQSHLDQLGDVIPALYQLAYDRYQEKGDRLYKTYQSWAELERLAAQQEQWEQEYELEEKKRKDAHDRFLLEQESKNSRTQTTQSQTLTYEPDYWTMLARYQNLGQNTQSQDTVSEPVYDNGNVSEGSIKTMQRVLGLEETGKWTETEHQKAGNLSADDAWLSYQKGQLQNRNSHGQWEQGTTVGNIKTMERVLGLKEDGYWSEADKKAAGGLTAFDAWKDYQKGKLQSRSRSGMSMEEWADLKKQQSQSSGFSMKETTRAVREFIGQMMTKEQASKRGITSKEWEAMVFNRLNHVKLSAAEFRQLELYYRLNVAGGMSLTADTDGSSAQKMSYTEYREKTAPQKIDDLNAEIQQYFRDYQAFANSAVYDLQNAGYQNAASMQESRIQTAADLDKRADILLTSLKTSGDIISGDYSELLDQIASTKTGIDSIMDFFDGYVTYYSQWDTEEAFIQATERSKQYYDNWGHYVNADDFDYYSAKGAAIQNPSMDAAESDGRFLWWEWEGDDIGNIVTYSRENAEMLATAYANGQGTKGNYKYRSMKDEEVDVYNYLLGKGWEDKANEFLAFMDEELNAREGGELAKRITGIDIPVVEDLAVVLYGIGAGIDQWASGTRQFFTNGLQPTTVEQYANSEIADTLDGIGQYAYTSANVIGNMAPSILLSYVTAGVGAPAAVAQGVGAAAVGMSAAGNAYGSALRDGYSIGQARAYSTLVGVAEGTLQYILGGIGSLGGVTDDLIKAKINMIDNSLLRISAKLGIDGLSEIGEEELQNYLEPAFRSIIFGEEYDAPTIDEMLETAIVTAGTTLLLGGSGTVSGDLAANRLLNATAQMANDQTNTPYNQEDIAKRLMNKGFNPKKSADMAEVIAARPNGQKLTKTQTGRLRSATDSGVVRDVMSDITKKKAAGIDSAQNRIYDREDISDGLTDEEKTALWDLAHQQVGIFSDHDYATATEHSVPHQVRNTFSEGVHGVGTDTVTYRRVQGGGGNNASQARIKVNADGSSSIPNKEANLSISIDGGEHAQYFLNKRGGDAQIIEIDVPKWFDDFLQENAIPQVNYKTNPRNQGGAAPKITDITTPGNCFELPAPWIEWLEEYGRNARIVNP